MEYKTGSSIDGKQTHFGERMATKRASQDGQVGNQGRIGRNGGKVWQKISLFEAKSTADNWSGKNQKKTKQ